MTRAVIKLSGDISSEMLRISKLIEGCAYNQGAKLMGFRFENTSVTVDSRQINIYHIEDEAIIKTFMDWFVALAENTDKSA